MTRYEMAQIVAKAMAKGANVDKLAAEFADELDALGVRVAALEKKSDNVKITGQIRYSYAQDKLEASGTDDRKKSNARLRTRLIFTGKVNDNWSFVNRLENNQYFHQSSKSSQDYVGEDDNVKINRAFMTGRLGGTQVEAGRLGLFLTDGMIYDDTMDGVTVAYGDKVNFKAYYGKLTEAKVNGYDDIPSDKAWGVHLDGDLGSAVNLFADYNSVEAKNNNWVNGNIFDDDKLNITDVGLKWKITDDVKLSGAYMHTNADDNDNGWYAMLNLWGASYSKPGSFGLEAVYYDQPAGSALAHTMNGNYKDQGLWADGFKGYSVAASYTVAKNMMAAVKYYDLKSRDDSDTKNKTIWSEFQLRF